MDTATSKTPESARPDWLLGAGMAAVGAAAAASSYAGLQNLAIRTGWVPWLSWLLPLTVDAYAMTATRVWLAKSTRNEAARQWAKRNAIGAIAVSVGGNAVDHATAAHVFAIAWPLVVAVSAIPPIVLGLLVHLAHLRAHTTSTPETDTPATPQPEATREGSAPPAPAGASAEGLPEAEPSHQPQASPPRRSRPRTTKPRGSKRTRTADELLAEAQQATADWPDGALTADAIRKAVRTSQTNARALREALKAERAQRRPLSAVDAPDTSAQEHSTDDSEGAAA